MSECRGGPRGESLPFQSGSACPRYNTLVGGLASEADRHIWMDDIQGRFGISSLSRIGFDRPESSVPTVSRNLMNSKVFSIHYVWTAGRVVHRD